MTKLSLNSFKQLKISQKLPLIIIGLTFFASVTIGIVAFERGKADLLLEEEEKFLGYLEGRKAKLDGYLESIQQDLTTQSSNPFVVEALKAFEQSWNALGSNQKDILQKNYINDNPFPTGEKEKLDFANDGSFYSEAHKKYHPWIRSFLNERGYYDIFLFDLKGNLIYTVFKELDYATNLQSGEYKDTDLGNAFRAALSGKAGDQYFFDFKPYAPSHGAAASFISSPIFDPSTGNILGVLVFQMPIDNINNIMQASSGLGETGEITIVGGDFLSRNDSRFSEETTILKKKIETESVKRGLSGKTGFLEVEFDGKNYISVYSPIDFLNTRWALSGKILADEVLVPVQSLRNFMIIAGLVIMAISAALSIWFARSLTKPIGIIVDKMKQVAEGQKEIEIPYTNKSDEIGEMANALDFFKQKSIEADELQEKNRLESEEREQKGKSLESSIHKFSTKFTDTVENLFNSTNELERTADTVNGISEETASKSVSMTESADQASSNVQTVASAAEELSASIAEIGSQANSSTEIAHRAVKQAEKTDATIQELNVKAQKIGEIVDIINEIAAQTNLLALNATIEAARAGDAGKGFAVVASEVKSLASQTGNATEEITKQIEEIQNVTGGAVSAIKDIGETIKEINNIASSIADSVEQQGSATEEIAKNVTEAAGKTGELTNNLSGVSRASSEVGQSVGQVLTACGDMKVQAENLKKEFDGFVEEVREA